VARQQSSRYIDKRRLGHRATGESIARGASWPGRLLRRLAVIRELTLDDPESPFRYGYVDTSGAVVIRPQFQGAFDFSEGLAVVAVKANGATKYGYIDKSGAWVIQPQFDNAGFFSEGLAAVGTRTSGTDADPTWITDYSWGYIDKTGTVVIPMQYQTADSFSGGVARVENWARVEGQQARNSFRRPTSTRRQGDLAGE